MYQFVQNYTGKKICDLASYLILNIMYNFPL
jgi:hypothetical protein